MVHFNFFVNAKKSLNVCFIGRHILFGAFMAAYHPQPHMPIEASGNMTDLSMQPLWPTLIFLVMQKSHFTSIL